MPRSNSKPAIDVTCIRGAGDREGPEITDSLVTSDRLATERGRAFIDDHWWQARTANIAAPHIAGLVKDGQVISIKALPLALDSKMLLRSLRGNVKLSPKPSIRYELELEQFLEPPDA